MNKKNIKIREKEESDLIQEGEYAGMDTRYLEIDGSYNSEGN